ncbi:MAG: response regulator [Elusimicrobiota bacterium]
MDASPLPLLRVIIVGGEPAGAAALEGRLKTVQGWSLEITFAQDARTAFLALRERFYDVAFLDHLLPDESGLKALEQMRQQYPKVAVVVTSAQGSEKLAVEAMRRGAFDYLPMTALEAEDMPRLLRRAMEMQLLQNENAELRQVNRMKDEFISSASHELRTPLAVILGYAKAMEDGELGTLTPQQALAVKAIRTRGERLLDMLNRLLTFKEAKFGTQEVLLRPMDLSAFVKEVLDSDWPKEKTHGLELERELPQGPAWTLIDPDHMKEVLNGLLSNAVKFSPPDVAVRISVEVRPTQEVWVRVSDRGRGIPHESLPRIFDAFYHTDSDLTRSISGLGLGLALARQIVELHGGRIWLESEGPGHGTTANVALPMVRPDSPLIVVESEKRVDKKHVLVVEDNTDVIEIIRLFLAGFSNNLVLTATSRGQEAMDLLAQRRFDLLVLDIFLAGTVSGFDILASVERLPSDKRMPVLVLTGHQGAAQDAMRKGAQDFLIKPFNKNRFIDKVLQLLGIERRSHPRA